MQNNRRNLAILFFTMVAVIGFGMIITILPFYIIEFGAGSSAMGLNNAFMSLGRSVGPLWAGLIYDINLSYPYRSGTIIMLVGFVISKFKLKNDQVILKGGSQDQVAD
jgi:MFS family permease